MIITAEFFQKVDLGCPPLMVDELQEMCLEVSQEENQLMLIDTVRHFVDFIDPLKTKVGGITKSACLLHDIA